MTPARTTHPAPSRERFAISVSALIEDRRGGDLGAGRHVLHGASEVLAAPRQLGSSRVSELQRGGGLPRTTMRRLLLHLENVGAVESSTGRWRLGPTVLELGAGVPACRPARDGARGPGLAPARVYHLARRGDPRTVLNAGAFDRRISSAAAPLRLSPQDLAVVWVIMTAGTGIPAPLAEATR